MKNAKAVLTVKFRTRLDRDELMKNGLEDIDLFRGVPGLVEKYYLTEKSTGDISGIYLFESPESLKAYLGSDFGKSVPGRYGVIMETVRMEQYDMDHVLNGGEEELDEKTSARDQKLRGAASKKIIKNHLKSFQENELETLMADYTNESVLITKERTYTGIDEICYFFTHLMSHFPKDQSWFKLDTIAVEGEFAYIVWHADTPTLSIPFGTDTFILKEGKILQQTFAGDVRYYSRYSPFDPVLNRVGSFKSRVNGI